MSFELTAEQQELQASLRQFFARKAGLNAVRRRYDDSAPDARENVWDQLTGELGLAALGIPEQYDGIGGGLREVAIAAEESGRVLLTAPWFASSVLAATTLREVGDEDAKAQFLPRIAAGELVATASIRRSPDEGTVRASLSDRVVHLEGALSYVVAGDEANLIIVEAELEGEPALFAVDTESAGLRTEALPVVDRARTLARVIFESVPAERIDDGNDTLAKLERAHALTKLGLAAEQVGGARACLDMAVAYAKIRHAFGRPIGSFQAIKHKCADIYIGIESAASTIVYAIDAADVAPPEEFTLLASSAHALATEAFLTAAADNIQIHGGIGFTWEHDAHLYLKRSRGSAELLGSRADNYLRIAELTEEGDPDNE